jgi:hypothetical protein
MDEGRKTALKTATVFAGMVLVAIGIAEMVSYWQYPRVIRGVVLVRDADPRKRLPIAGVEVSTGNDRVAHSDVSGLFVLDLKNGNSLDRSIILKFKHPAYQAADIADVVRRKLYVVYLDPLTTQRPATPDPTAVKISDVRIRYTLEVMTQFNIGSAVKSFEVPNKGNVPCEGQPPCSPDGRWKAALGTASLDAGRGNQFQYARASCIAGPCPFTRIEYNDFRKGGQTITVSVRNWSDTASFLLEAAVFRRMSSQTEYWSYPVIFGDQLSFTLPESAESVSIEADVGGETIIFPLGPALRLSWANCDTNKLYGTSVYRCTVKAGYRLNE